MAMSSPKKPGRLFQGRLGASVAVVLLAIHLPSQAEDIDLFVGTPANATVAPNVLIILDNTANWTNAFSAEMTALGAVLNSLPADKFRVGLMMFSETGGGNSGESGAYVRAAIRLMDSANKTKYQSLITSFTSSTGGDGDGSNNGKTSKAMQEAYLYFTAGIPYSGNNKNKTDYVGNTFGTTASNAVYALTGNALASKAATSYISPIASGCAKNFIIYLSNNSPQENNNDIRDSATFLATLPGANTTPIPISPSGSQNSVTDEWARYMKQSSLGITTYTVEVVKGGGQEANWTALMKSAANVSSGKYFDVTANPSSANISAALNSIFSEIQSVNSVFASVSLPVSVNTQGTFLNQVYIGMFRPDQDAAPRWAGNLKQYKLGLTDGILKLQDANSASAINSGTGFITECARSFWTPSSADSYWAFRPQGGCLTIPGADDSNYPDGNIVEKGAQAYRLRSDATRTVKTCSATSCTALTSFATSNAALTTTLLGAADATEKDALIDWARGVDNKDEDLDGNLTEMRPYIHGDVVHSRPVAINLGSDVSPEVMVFYGGNDGLLHAINGNRTSSLSGFAAGSELWSFMPPEFYSKIKRLRDNTTTINFPGTTITSPTPQSKPYGFDGPITAIKNSTGAWVYASMRRGGRALYAFDINGSGSPTLKWKKGCPNAANDTGCSTDFSGLGQTWTSALSLKAGGYGAGASPMLIMGGGYDSCEDGDPHSCDSSTKGNKIYIMDAGSGDVLQTFDTVRSVVADTTVVNDSNGLVRYIYAADMGGNVYRISGATANTPIGTTAPGSWTITPIAALGCGTASATCTNRKFMFAPDVVVDNGSYILLIGSGDREKPLTSYTAAAGVSNYFFMLRDKPTVSTWLSDENANCSANLICLNSLYGITGSATPTNAQLASKPKGWYLGLASAEQVVTSAITVFGTVTFSTHQPITIQPGTCSNLGSARVYNIDYLNAEGENGVRFQDIAGDGLPPSPVAGMVTLDNGSTVPFIIGADPDSPLEGAAPPPPPTSTQPKARVYWNIEQ